MEGPNCDFALPPDTTGRVAALRLDIYAVVMYSPRERDPAGVPVPRDD